MELFDIIFASLDPKVAKYVVIAIGATTAAMPLLEWIAERTSWKWDNQAVAFLKTVLAKVPRLRFGNAPAPSRSSAPTNPETPNAKAKAHLGD